MNEMVMPIIENSNSLFQIIPNLNYYRMNLCGIECKLF